MLKGRIAVITGASRGIGRAIALRFAENGASLVLNGRNEERLKKSVEDAVAYGVSAEGFIGDIANPHTALGLAERAVERFGGVDILVYSAGIVTRTPVEELAPEEWHSVMNVNLSGFFYMCKAVLPFMRRRKRGKIISLSSQMAKMPHPNASPSYEVSKAGIQALTRHLAYHYAKYNIQVNSIAPGSIDTDMPKTLTPEAREKLKDSIPLLRLGEPEEVADCALFLASSMADYITGETVNVNGGSLMC